MSKKFTHFNEKGDAHMVNISEKSATYRIAIAEGNIIMQPETLQQIQAGNHKKGDVLAVAQLAGIMASKRTADLIPLCHPLSLSHVSVEFKIDHQNTQVCCIARTETCGRTGVEMEALTAVQIALLTIYDMCKAVDKGMIIAGVKLCYKAGGAHN